MDTVRIGIIGLGNMGAAHARWLLEGKIARARLAAVCDSDPAALARFPQASAFPDASALIRSGAVDAVLVATPHYSHVPIGVEALGAGLHVLVEKPIAVHKRDAEMLLAAHTDGRLAFAAMFMMRTDPVYRRLKRLIDQGELGRLARVTWIVTDWFRSEAYYASGGWRATWEGEGGGVLLNQCPHNLDLLQWLCGMPKRVAGFCGLGVRHAVEVEDQVTAYLEYAGGATGTFITSTGEAPGTNRLEIAGDRGKVVVEGGKIAFTRNEVPASEFSRTTASAFGKPEVWNVEVPAGGAYGGHNAITQNFVDAILDGAPLIAPAEEGIKSVELANAILYSSLLGRPVDLPLDGEAYARKLQELIAGSTLRKKAAGAAPADFETSFRKP